MVSSSSRRQVNTKDTKDTEVKRCSAGFQIGAS